MRKKILIPILLTAFMLASCSGKAEKFNSDGLNHYNAGNYTEAVSSYEAAIEANKGNAKYYINNAMALIELGDYENALTKIGYALELEPGSQEAYRAKGIIYIALNDYENALLALETALSFADGFVGSMEYDILDYRAVAEIKSANYEKAIATYSILIDINYKLQDHYYLRGSAYLLSGNADAAKADFAKAVELQSSDYNLYLNIYTALTQHGYEEDANSYLAKALEADTGKKEDSFAKGKIYYYMNDYQNAITHLYNAREKSPEAYLFLGKIYVASGDYTQALISFQQYLETDPENGEVYNQLGMMKYNDGAYEEALQYFQTGLACNDLSSRKTLAFNEAITYEKLLDFTTAKEKLAAYVSSYPEDTAAKREYDFLKTR